ncbi:DUF2637 domain-containing protein [Streptomyces sp. SID3212]|uniref:DUF2637 domain-containing protein n=1 Tax=Streptomyces sp. SID3212 TaxID=2690259 RepID=UPI00136E7340|nr:DUF2637 domain-containing protein [Streptomyces sp. SID3212]MYV53716.1 DUF2637 domain-containing protein [Streptomyces sp. SID3212]
MPDTAIPTTDPARPTGRHRATWWDQLAIILLGLAGCALSFDALRQMATAVHVRPQLTYLFPIVIDGFIAYGVRALLVLREAPLPARLYAWALFIAATAASIWANGLHALDLNQPGTVGLHLDDPTVTVLSAIAPLALAGATHLHILITRYGGTDPARTPADGNATPVPYQSHQSDGTPHSCARKELERLAPQTEPARTADAETAFDQNSDGVDRSRAAERATAVESPQGEPEDAGEDENGGSVQRRQRQGGRPPMATLEQLVNVIAAAHPDPDSITRDSARKSLTEAELGAGTLRLTEAITLVRAAAQPRQHPDRPDDPQPLTDQT